MIKQILAKAAGGPRLSKGSTAPPSSWYSPDPWVRFGTWTLIALVTALTALSFVFTISGAIVASGLVTVEGAYQSVQNTEAAIVRKILVKDGDQVKRGQALVELDATDAKAALSVARDKILELTLQSARLAAERDGARLFVPPPSVLRQAGRPMVQTMIASQRAVFKARMSSLNGQRNVLAQQITQQQDLLSGLRAQHTARARETGLAARRLAGVQKLYDKGFANKQQLTSAQRDTARLQGDLGALQSEIARTGSAIAEARLRLEQLQKQNTQQIVEELTLVQTARGALEETFKTQQARLDRVILRSPLAGYVHALSVHTLGGVLPAGTQVLQIIPTGKKLIIEARVKPADIDKLSLGQSATVRLPAFNAQRTPQLKGVISSLSPAQLNDPRTGDYFKVAITLPRAQIAKIGASHKLTPGMPAQVFIETRSRSIMSYFIKPLVDAMSYALREE